MKRSTSVVTAQYGAFLSDTDSLKASANLIYTTFPLRSELELFVVAEIVNSTTQRNKVCKTLPFLKVEILLMLVTAHRWLQQRST